MATPPFVLKKKNNSKNDTLPEKMDRATDIKREMQTQLDFANNVEWVPFAHTSFSWCVKLKILKMVLLIKYFNLIACSLLF